jgi:transcriptional regulator with XRE-family HTH domain
MPDPSDRHISPRRAKASRVLWGPQYEQFRARLVKARKLAKLTQHEAATALGRSQSFVAKSENGERRVDVVELLEFCRVYRKKIWWFARADPPTRKRPRP